jgi:hypothetical protein
MAEDSGLPAATGSLLSMHGADDLSPLEQDVLDEYERLADNMKKVCKALLLERRTTDLCIAGGSA